METQGGEGELVAQIPVGEAVQRGLAAHQRPDGAIGKDVPAAPRRRCPHYGEVSLKHRESQTSPSWMSSRYRINPPFSLLADCGAG